MKTTIEITLNVEVSYNVSPGCYGSRDSMGIPLEPDSPEEIEDIEIHWKPYNQLDPADQDYIIECLQDDIHEYRASLAMEEAEQRYQDKIERW